MKRNYIQYALYTYFIRSEGNYYCFVFFPVFFSTVCTTPFPRRFERGLEDRNKISELLTQTRKQFHNAVVSIARDEWVSTVRYTRCIVNTRRCNTVWYAVLNVISFDFSPCTTDFITRFFVRIIPVFKLFLKVILKIFKKISFHITRV